MVTSCLLLILKQTDTNTEHAAHICQNTLLIRGESHIRTVVAGNQFTMELRLHVAWHGMAGGDYICHSPTIVMWSVIRQMCTQVCVPLWLAVYIPNIINMYSKVNNVNLLFTSHCSPHYLHTL